MTVDHWRAMVAHLAGHKVHPLPGPAGTVHACRDDPLTEADCFDIDSPVELARVLGISRKEAELRLQAPAERVLAGDG